MNRLASVLTLFVALLLADAAHAQCCGGAVTTSYYAPTSSNYAPSTTVYYAPAPAYSAPVTTAYYAPSPVYYAAPATVYYRPLVGAGITRVGYAPVTYVAPTTYYAPARYYAGYSPWW